MELIDKFASRVMRERDSFLIKEVESDKSTKYYHFLQGNVGKARYIYGIYSWEDEKFYSKIEHGAYEKYGLVAIVRGKNVYVYDEIFLGVWDRRKNTELPANVRFLSDVTNNKNKHVSDVVFRQFYDALKATEIEDEGTLKLCMTEARKILFSKDGVLEEKKLDPMFNEQDIANMLCGFVNIDNEALRRLEKDIDSWILKKSVYEKIKALVESEEVAETWELAIAKGLRSVDAKTVTVEFEFKEKTGVAKIDVKKVLELLVGNGYFSDYDFVTRKMGKELFESLRASDSTFDKENHLKCGHISKITYGTKILYVKV